MNGNSPNARFWIFVNDGPVKLTIKPGRPLHYYKWWRHDEGWSSEYVEWGHLGEGVMRVTETDGTDCDGRMSTGSTCTCRIEDLHMGSSMDGVTYPLWKSQERSQRDYQAEAAGY